MKSRTFTALVLLAVGAAGIARAQTPNAIRLRSGTIDTSAPSASLEESAVGEEILLVQFPGPVTAGQVAGLRAAGRVYTYLPDNAFLVKVPAGARQELQALGVSWIGPYRPSFKMSPAVSSISSRSASSAAAPEERRIVMLHLFPDADVREVAGRLRQGLGRERFNVVGSGAGHSFSRIRLLMTPSEIAAAREALADLREVFWIDVEPRRALLNDTTVWVGQSGLDNGGATPVFDHGLFGQGQTVGILDTGIDIDMCYFSDPARGVPPINACDGGTAFDPKQRKVVGVNFFADFECANGIGAADWDNHDHGTHVAGTVAGDNLAHPFGGDPGDGMAPAAKLVIQDGGYLVDDCGDLPGIGCPIVDLKPIFQQAYDQGARIHTNSWGDNENAVLQNDYTSGSQDVDEFMWTHKDFLLFFAAGNSGPGDVSVGSPSTAKNGVSVGAALHGADADGIAPFSSCGPTADGRTKPDVTIPGNAVVSANNDATLAEANCGTRAMSGTSMASPGAAGLTALIRQYYTEGWYPKGRKGGKGFTPSAALLKATLINSAVPMSGVVRGTCQGWGRILLDNALFFSGDSRKLWLVDEAKGFATGNARPRTWKIKVRGSEPLKLTLVWTDFPSTPAAEVNLVNDLDLAVTGPRGTVWLGNVFADGQSAEGGSPDRRNTVEQILIDNPPPGTYTVSVKPFNVPQGKQPFALVVTGG